MVTIESTRFGEIDIGGKTYYSDVTVWWDGSIEQRSKSKIYDEDCVAQLLKRGPEAVVIGTGQKGTAKLTQGAKQLLLDRDVKLYLDDSAGAIEIFNSLASRGKKVVAVIRATD